MKSKDFKICDVIIGIATYWMLHLCLFLLKPKYYQNELGQRLVCCMTNISNMFLAQCWRLETSSRPFHDFIKMTIYRDLAIFSGLHLPFSIVPYLIFKKMKRWNHDLIGY